jgi:hypothetical protein
MKKIIIDDQVVELDETQEFEVSQLFPELGEALENESEVRIELVGSSDEIEHQLDELENIAHELERCMEKVRFVNQSSIRAD